MRVLRVALLRKDLRDEQNQPKNEQEPGTDLGVPARKLPLALDLASSGLERLSCAYLRTVSRTETTVREFSLCSCSWYEIAPA